MPSLDFCFSQFAQEMAPSYEKKDINLLDFQQQIRSLTQRVTIDDVEMEEEENGRESPYGVMKAIDKEISDLFKELLKK